MSAAPTTGSATPEVLKRYRKRCELTAALCNIMDPVSGALDVTQQHALSMVALAAADILSAGSSVEAWTAISTHAALCAANMTPPPPDATASGGLCEDQGCPQAHQPHVCTAGSQGGARDRHLDSAVIRSIIEGPTPGEFAAVLHDRDELRDTWNSVIVALNAVYPGWLDYDGSGIACAVHAIESLARGDGPNPSEAYSKLLAQYSQANAESSQQLTTIRGLLSDAKLQLEKSLCVQDALAAENQGLKQANWRLAGMPTKQSPIPRSPNNDNY